MGPGITTSPADDRPPPATGVGPGRLRVLAAVIVVVAVLAVVADAPRDARSTDAHGLAPAIALAVGGVVLLALCAAGRARSLALTGLGLALVAVGSGLVRTRRSFMNLDPGDTAGTVGLRLDTWWPVVVVGLALIVGGLLTAGRGPTRVAAHARLFALAAGGVAAGVVAVALVWRDVAEGVVMVGRPLRRHGRRVPLPPVDEGAADAATPAGWWQEAAAEEAASVAAFEDLAARLSGLGAPDDLVRRARAAARDEVRHARVCTHLARRAAAVESRRHDPGTEAVERAPGVDAGSGPAGDLRSPRPEAGLRRQVALAGLAAESFADGAVGERFSAARLEAGAATVADPAARPLLLAMARDEARHADLGADVVAWCRTQSPRLVAAVVDRLGRRLPLAATVPPSHSAASPAALRRAGFVPPAEAQALWSAAGVSPHGS